MRVLTVTQRLLQVVFQEEFFGQPGLGAHIAGNHRVVLRRVRVGLGRERETRFGFRVAGGADLVEHDGIVGRIADHRHVAPVLGGAAQHRRTADVDILDGVFHRNARLGDRGGEGIEIDAHQVDEFDAVLAQGLQMRRQVAPAKQGAVHLRVQGLHTAVADFGKARHFADADRFHAFLFQQALRAARGDDLPAEPGKCGGEISDAPLVAYADKCSHCSSFRMVSI